MRQYPLKISLLYLIAGLTWILITDKLLKFVGLSFAEQPFWQTAKGFVFIIITAIALFLILLWHQKVIRKTELKFKGLFEFHPNCMCIYEFNTMNILAVNKATMEKYGFTKEEFANMRFDELLINDTPLSYAISEVPEQQSRIMHHRNKTGDSFYVRCISNKTKFEEKEAIYALLVDIEAEIQVMKKLKEVSWMQSHTVRRPLANILGVVELMKMEKNPQSGFEPLVPLLEIAAKELDDVIKDIVTKANERPG